MTARESFVATLRQHRERSGLSLDSVADATKVSPLLLSSLERADVSRWPGGLYRRSFVRAYARAIGLPPEATLREFVRLFPEPGQEATGDATEDVDTLRIALVPERRWHPTGGRALAAALDVTAVAVVGYGVSIFAGQPIWMATAIAAAMYHAASLITLGRSPATYALEVGLLPRRTRATQTEALAELRRDWASEWLDSSESSTRKQIAS